ncbi:hypothetical protein ABPG75_011694 [Micractinium tetrahymenae]
MEAAVEISNLPPSATFDELRAVLGARSVVFSLEGPQLSALAFVESPAAAAEAAQLLHGSDWGGRTLQVTPAHDVGGWVAARCAQLMPGSHSLASGSGSAPPEPAPAAAAEPAGPQQQQQPSPPLSQQLGGHEDQPRAPGFELPDWGWDQAAAAAGQDAAGQHASFDDASWADQFWGEPGGSQRGEDEWREVGARERRVRCGGGGGGEAAGAAAAGPGLQGALSDTRIMVRNLDPGCTQEAVVAAFARFGRILQAVKHPNRRFAHIQFARPEGAAAALREMHEQLVPSLNSQGLIFVQPSLVADDASVRRAMQQARDSPAAASGGGGVQDRVAALAGFGAQARGSSKGISQAPTSAIWVGSMGPGATSDDVRAVFSRYGPLVQWQVQQAKLPGKSGNMRYAIVRWRRVEEARAAVDALNGQVEPRLGPFPLKIKYRETA